MTERVSVSSDEEEQWSGAIVPITADISADGRYVVFGSDASNLTASDDNGVQDVFLRDRQLGITELISVTPGGVAGSNSSFGGAISDDGRFVCFDSFASDLTPGDDNANTDVFVRDRELATTEKVSVGDNGTPGNGRSYRSAISADGSIVAFASESTNLVQLDTNGVTDVFVRNRTLASTVRVSVASDGAEGNGASGWDQIGEYFPIGLSADGRFVLFGTFATSILARDRTQNFEAVLHDRATGISQRPVGVPGATVNLSPLHSSLSANGRLIAFASETPLLRSDKNRAADIYVADRKDPGSGRLSAAAPKWKATVVGETSSATLKIANRGHGSLSVQVSSVSGPFSIDPAFRQFTLAPGGRMQVPVTFAPLAAGPASGEVALYTDDPRRPTAALKLRARGR
jgi:Tol biopolymer transport system component